MTNLSRRCFLRGTIAVAAAVTMPMAAVSEMFRPLLIGDGVHDDTAALQALLDGDPVDILNDGIRLLRSEGLELQGGVYRLTRTIVLRRDNLTLRNITFNANHDGYVFYASAVRDINLDLIEARRA